MIHINHLMKKYIPSLYVALFFSSLPSNLSAQHNILDNPFQHEWLNQVIDTTNSTDILSINFEVGISTGDTFIQISELQNGNLQKIETFNSFGVSIQLCEVNNGTLICGPDSSQIELTENRTIWAAGNSIPCSYRDSLELVRFYWTLDGPQWDKSWDLNQAVSTWDGVDLFTDDCVRCLDADINAEGVLHDYHFPEIRRLKFGILNELHGQMVDFQHMPKLEVLNILGKSLNGEIPNFSNLPALEILTLNQSEFTGSIPNFDKLPNLRSIDLSKNNLTGEIPLLNHCLGLRGVNFPVNNLEGEIPNFENHAELRAINFRENNLTGEIPEFNNNPLLNSVVVSSNNLTGSIPQFLNNPSLQTLDLYRNQLTGSIPEFEMSQQLKLLRISDNLLTGAIPSFEFSPVENFWCFGNYISEPVPNFAESCPTLILCWIDRNSMTYEDLLPNFLANDTTCVSPIPELIIGGYLHEPQNRIYYDTTFMVDTGGSLIIDLEIDDTITTNVYQWIKDDSFYREIIGVNEIEFTNMQASDSGIYKVMITNPGVPELTLTSYDIEIIVEETSAIEIVLETHFRIYPNPIGDILTIESLSGFSVNDEISVFNSRGKIIKIR